MDRIIKRAHHPRLAAALAGGAALLIAGCDSKDGDAPGQVASDVLAKVDGHPVTAAGYRYWWQRKNLTTDTPAARTELLDVLIERAALVEEARRAGLDQDPLLLEQMENLLINRLEEAQLHPQIQSIEVSDREIRDDYESRREEQFSLPAQDHLAVLWFKTRGQAPLAERYQPRLARARAELLARPDAYPLAQGFGSLAIQNSEHRASRYQGGDLGWVEARDQAGFLRAAHSIGLTLKQAGDLSEVIVNDQGVFLVRLIERRPAGVKPLSAVSASIERKLRAQKQQSLEREFRRRIHDAATITRYGEHLDALMPLSPPTQSAGQPTPGIPSNPPTNP